MSVEYFEEQRREMIAAIRVIARPPCRRGRQDRAGRCESSAAMAKVPRHEFVPVEVQPYAYLNRPLPIGFDKTISQPLMVAVMTDLLELKPDDVVLEIGTGLGYQAAVLAELAGRVYSVEIIDELAQRAVQAAETTGLHQRRSPRRERLFRLARARPVRQGDRHSGARPDPTSPDQPAQGWRKDGDPGRPARRPAACRSREGLERQGHDQGNYAGTCSRCSRDPTSLHSGHPDQDERRGEHFELPMSPAGAKRSEKIEADITCQASREKHLSKERYPGRQDGGLFHERYPFWRSRRPQHSASAFRLCDRNERGHNHALEFPCRSRR